MLRVEFVVVLFFSMASSVIRRYGVYAVVTKSARRIGHAATGRAKRSSTWGVLAAHSRAMVGDTLPAKELIARLRAERETLQTSYSLVA